MAACVAEAGTPVLLIDLDPQANATTGLGFRPDQLEASTYDLLHGRPLDEVVVDTSIPNLDLAPSHPDLAAAQVELPKRRRSRHAAARHPGRHRGAVSVRVRRLPAVARPAHRQRPCGGQPADRAGAVRVLRAGGARPAAPERRARAHAAQSPAGRDRRAADDVRRPHAAGRATSRARCARISARSCSRPSCRAACGSPRRPATACRSRRYDSAPPAPTHTIARRWRWSSVAEPVQAARPRPRAGRARGRVPGGGGMAWSRSSSIEFGPTPASPAGRSTKTRSRGWPSRSGREGVVQPIIVRDAGDGYEIIAGERRWRAARRAGLRTIPAVVRHGDERERSILAMAENVARVDLNAGRPGAGIRRALGRARSHPDRDRPPGRQEPAGDREHDAAAGAARRRARPDRRRRALRGPRPRAAARSGQDERLALARLAVQRGWSVRETEAAARGTGRKTPKPARRAGSMDDELANLAVDAAWHRSTCGPRCVRARAGAGSRCTSRALPSSGGSSTSCAPSACLGLTEPTPRVLSCRRSRAISSVG